MLEVIATVGRGLHARGSLTWLPKAVTMPPCALHGVGSLTWLPKAVTMPQVSLAILEAADRWVQYLGIRDNSEKQSAARGRVFRVLRLDPPQCGYPAAANHI